jgi:hypothetical protein
MKYIIAVVLSALLLTHYAPIHKQVIVTASAHRATVAPKASTPTPTQSPQIHTAVQVITPVVVPAPQPTDHEILMNLAGIKSEDYGAANYIIFHESSWSSSATEPISGAYGLCQSLPAIKMASAGSDWLTNSVTQLKWCNQYAIARYGGWQEAYTHWLNNRWW